MQIRKHVLVVFLLAISVMTWAQDASMQSLKLEDLSAFKQQAGNWQIVGDVVINPLIDIHHKAEAPVAETSKKSKKSKTAATPAPTPQAVTFTAGKGILLNMNDDTRKDHLLTNLEHGDIELELEVMIPKGSNSGIYLQGRYEVQLLDSWGVKNPKYSDIGGIYRNWEKEPGKIYMGKAPLTNAAKAPGLWQKMKISFRAPRFDTQGKKVANARFVYVDLNGVRIHENLEVPLPTGGPVENNEKAFGPLMIQGDHGPVAIRNVNYKLLKDIKATLGPVSYKIYSGSFKEIADFTNLKPVKTGTSNELTCEVLDDENNYGIVYAGTITIPDDNKYQFTVVTTGGTKLVLNNQTLIDLQRGDAWDLLQSEYITLKAGTYPFEIYNFKTASWMPPRLAFGVQTNLSSLQELHAYNSYPQSDEPTSPIYLDAGAQPRLLRAFLDFNGQRSQRLTHTIGVGDPSGTHYVYDLERGNLACVWRGNFVDATPMWHDRGDGSFRPRGGVQYLFVSEPLAFLATASDAFPGSVKEGEFKSKGYTIDEATGRPVFKYVYQGLEVEDRAYPDDENRSVTHEIKINNRGSKTGLYYKLAEGTTITAMADGYYSIDKQYYVKPASAVTIRTINGKQELVMTVDGSSVKYTIIW